MTLDSKSMDFKNEGYLQRTEDAEWEEDFKEGDWEQEAEEDAMKDAVFNQMNFELEKVMKDAEKLKPECKLPAVPASVDLDEFMDSLYPPAKGGLTASHALAGYDSMLMVTHFLSKEKDYDCSDVLNGLVTRSKFLKHVDKEFGESWFDEFKQSKWLPLLKQIRWIERKRKVGQSDFTVKRSVGRGAFGVVSVVIVRYTGEVLALKDMNKKVVKHKANDKARNLIQNERVVLSLLGEKPAFCCLNLRYAFETSASYALAFQFCCGGDLDYRLNSYRKKMRNEGVSKLKGLPEKEVQFYAAEMAVALNHLHGLGIIHRDMKPLNILLTKEGHCVLSDFGLATRVKKGKEEKKGRIGTPGFFPPEMLEKKTHSYPADWYSYGATLYTLIRGVDPLHPEITGDGDRKASGLTFEPQYPEEYFSTEAAQFINHCMVKDPKNRASYVDIKKHPWLAKIDWEKAEVGALQPVFVPGIGINAKSIFALLEEGEADEELQKRVKLDEKDTIKKFNYVSRKGQRNGMKKLIDMMADGSYDALPTFESYTDAKANDGGVLGGGAGGAGEETKVSGGSGCCVIV